MGVSIQDLLAILDSVVGHLAEREDEESVRLHDLSAQALKDAGYPGYNSYQGGR